MSLKRFSLNNLGKKPPYLLFSLVFFSLSLIGFFIFQKINLPAPAPAASLYYPQLPPLRPTAPSTPAPPLAPLDHAVSPTQAPSIPAPAPAHLLLESSSDGFSLLYSPHRQISQDEHKGANRYTLYHSDGSFAVHVGPDWTWYHPGREFSSDFKVDGQDSFRYDINLQTIVDIDKGQLKYTIQCIHNAKPERQAECAALLASFKFL